MFNRTAISAWLVSFLMFITAKSYTRDSNGNRTLQNCIQYALKNNLQIKKSEITVSQNKISYKQAKAAGLDPIEALRYE